MPGVASPPVILEGFGFGAGSSYITTPIPFASQQPNPRASYTDGFPPQTVGATQNTITVTGAENYNGVATGHNNLQPYRVVRMWRRTA